MPRVRPKKEKKKKKRRREGRKRGREAGREKERKGGGKKGRREEVRDFYELLLVVSRKALDGIQQDMTCSFQVLAIRGCRRERHKPTI